MQAPPHSEVTEDDFGSGLPGRSAAAFVTLAFQAERPLEPPLRLPLSHVDSAWFGRGRGAVEARVERADGESRLRVAVPDRFLSSSHASVQRVLGSWLLEDNASRNGTFADGRRVDRFELRDGAVFEIGRSWFVFRAAASDEAPADGGSLQPEFCAGLRALDRAAATSIPVVLRGETGTGKEVLARLVHQKSGRPGPFQPINCAALAPTLLESELFGHRRGAFSGAQEERPGLIRSADKGTLFLDEIGDLPLPAQGTLLRVLQESEVVPVGATQAVPVDFRLIVATHRNLEEMAAQGQFRADLLGRIAGFTLRLPPLRERKEDLGALIGALLLRHAPGRARELRFSAAAARALFLHSWPLNVRELEKALLLALTVAPDAIIDAAHLPEAVRAAAVPHEEPAPSLGPEDAGRREELLTLLREHNGNVTAVARALGKARMQVQRWLRRYRIQPALFR
jgi:transcriptional regulator of acetoin/glycerol metabolism